MSAISLSQASLRERVSVELANGSSNDIPPGEAHEFALLKARLSFSLDQAP